MEGYARRAMSTRKIKYLRVRWLARPWVGGGNRRRVEAGRKAGRTAPEERVKMKRQERGPRTEERGHERGPGNNLSNWQPIQPQNGNRASDLECEGFHSSHIWRFDFGTFPFDAHYP